MRKILKAAAFTLGFLIGSGIVILREWKIQRDLTHDLSDRNIEFFTMAVS